MENKRFHQIVSKDGQAAKSLYYSFWDGVFANGMIGFTQDYFIPFALLLGASTKVVGILNSFQNFAASLIQLASPELTARLKSRRKIINTFVLLQALTLLPMVFLAFSCKAPVYVFIGCVILFSSCGALSLPAWQSLMSDLVVEKERGRYFGWRNRTLGLVSVAGGLTAGLILQRMKDVNICYGFAIVFFMAFVFRFGCWYFLVRMHEPPLHHAREDQFTIFMFWRRLRESNFAKFVLFVALMNFSVNLASPFFAVLMLRDLHFSYWLYGAITVTATLTVCLVSSRWGRIADKVGNLKILRLTAPLIGSIPLLWIFWRHPAFLFFAQVFSGFAWAGFNLCIVNFVFDAVTPEKRTRCMAYLNAFNGMALGLGALLGGFLVPHLPSLFGFKILMLLLISSFLRIAVSFTMPYFIKEVRDVEPMGSGRLFLGMLGVAPFTTKR